jgi:hypothetical protein
MGQNLVTTVALFLQCLQCKGIRKLIFFWLCIISFVKKNNCENPSPLFFFRSGLIVMGDLPRWKKYKENGPIVMDDLPK